MTHDEIRYLMPIYALDALMSEETRQLQDHLDICPDCLRALRLDLETAGELALACPPVSVDAALRGRILAGAGQIPQALPLVSPRRRRLGRHKNLASNRAILRSQERFLDNLASPVLSALPMVAAGRGKPAGTLYFSADGSSGGLVAVGLADPGEQIYQLWLLVDGQPSPMQAFRPDPRGLALVAIEGGLSRLHSFAVTLERRPGNPAPQGSMVLRSA